MPEQPTMSIKVTIAPQVAGGLEALVRDVLSRAAKERKSARPVRNRAQGTVHGTVFQIGNVEGDFHHHG
ncbi:hypothetical protein [Lentzea nigeriaca]|uniref:hypothetical protein n=1 Tax=Lentzea nigeriaca TaxID=1128665 RepID=UPI0019568C4A|nr:hypothetical protein [Lentzea nigeriaca]MBM7860801.1 hypothetical protein [Lentzea nigeriaca]